MINEIIKEIKQCLNNGCVMAALSLTLILPDICGQAMYPKLEYTNKRYTKWIDENIGQYAHDHEHKIGYLQGLSGKIIYSLRCSVLHQGNPNIKENKDEISYFELIYRKNEGAHVVTSSLCCEIVKDEAGNDIAKNKRFSINVRELCRVICKLSEACYKENKDKFKFFNYDLVDTDFHTRCLFRINDVNVIK